MTNEQNAPVTWRVIIAGEWAYFDSREEAESAREEYDGDSMEPPGFVPEPMFSSPAAPPSVTDAVVDRALNARPWGDSGASVGDLLEVATGSPRRVIRAALEAALTHPGHKHAQEDAAQEGLDVGALVSAAMRALPFLEDEANKYEDDGQNEPLETLRDLRAAINAYHDVTLGATHG